MILITSKHFYWLFRYFKNFLLTLSQYENNSPFLLSDGRKVCPFTEHVDFADGIVLLVL